jgi:SAM-dependent methyltransferase
MDKTLVTQLTNLNKKFYSEVAVEFDATRQKPWSGWVRSMEFLENQNVEIKSCLDIACGNGRFGDYLSQISLVENYVGIDFSQELISAADEKLSTAGIKYKLICGDVLEELEKIKEQFDLVVMFGILHHIPGFENRRKLIKKAYSKLKKGGILIFTVWQFVLFERFRRRLLDNKEIRENFGIDTKHFEEGDYILDWQRGKTGYRYTHYSSDSEVQRFLEDIELEEITQFEKDGRTANVNKYFLYRKQ